MVTWKRRTGAGTRLRISIGELLKSERTAIESGGPEVGFFEYWKERI